MSNTKDWRDPNWYKAKEGATCAVCDSRHEIGIEPRFNYHSCQVHAELTPVAFSELRAQREGVKQRVTVCAVVVNEEGAILPHTCQPTKLQCEEEANKFFGPEIWAMLKKKGYRVREASIHTY